MKGFVVHPISASAIADSGRQGRRTVVPSGYYTRRAPFYLDMDQAQNSTAQAMAVYMGAVKADYQTIEIHELSDALVCGQGAVVTRNRELLHDSVLEFLASGEIPDGFTAAEDGLQIVPPVTTEIEAPCILAKRPWFRNFGHWIVDAAALVALTAKICRAEGLTIVVGDVGTGPLRNVMLDTIGRILPGSRVLFHPDNETWRFRSLRYVTPVHVPPLFKLPKALSDLRDAILPEWSTIEPFRKIFVLRGTNVHVRSLGNSDRIVDLCRRRGYDPVMPELLPIHEAARIFAEAKMVIGVKGAALTNTLFCRPGAMVMTLSPADFPDPFFWDLVAQREVGYGELYGTITTDRRQAHNDFIINPARLTRMLDAADHAAVQNNCRAPGSARNATADATMATMIPGNAGVPCNDQELVQCFESLGDNREFSLVQRFAGTEPLGLFRFNFTKLASLITGLKKRFSDLALPGQVQVGWAGEWIVTEKLYDFVYPTFNHDETLDQGRLESEQARWLRYMADKFLERLALADHIFIRKGDPLSSESDIRSLHAAMRTFGNAILLWVCEVDADHVAGEVEWLDSGLMRGWIGAFAPHDRVMDDVDPTTWLRLCRRAWALAYLNNANAYPHDAEVGPGALDFGGWSGSGVATSELAWAISPAPTGGHVMRHHLIAEVREGQDIFGCLVSTGLAPGGLYTASVYIRLPGGFTGTNLGLVMLGRPTLHSGRIDLQMRETWQRLWVTAFLGPEDTMAFPRLVLSGPPGTTVYSAGWRLDACSIPT